MNLKIILFGALLYSMTTLVALAETQQYHKKGLRIDYPENWKVTLDSRAGIASIGATLFGGAKERVVLLEQTDDNAILSIYLRPLNKAQALRDYAGTYAKDYPANLPPFFKCSASSFSALDPDEAHKSWTSVHPGIQETLKEDFLVKMSMLDVELATRREYFKIVYPSAIAYLIFQVSEEDLPLVKADFALLLRSFSLQAENEINATPPEHME